MGAVVRSILAVIAIFSITLQTGIIAEQATALGRDINSDYLGIAPGRFNSIKAIDIDKDSKIEILFGDYNGYINSIEWKDGAYFDEWQSPKVGSRTWGLEVGDPDQNGVNEVLTGDADGFLYVMNYSSSKIIWQSKFLGRDVHGIKVADIDSDGKNEIVAGTGYKTDFPAGKVFVFSYNQTAKDAMNIYIPKKTFGINGEISFDESKHRGVCVGDVNSDGKTEIVIGSGVAQGERPGQGYIRVVDGKTGRLEWMSEDLNGDADGLAVHDIDKDGCLEIIVGTGYRYQEGYIFIFKYSNNTHTYERLWKSDNVGPKAFGLAVSDIDGDGASEIISGNQPGYIRIFDGSSHNLEWKSRLLGTDVLGVTLADIDKDGDIEIIAGQGGYDGKGDFTSAYTAPHIYIIDGKTHEIESTLGELEYVGLAFQVAIIILFIILLMVIKKYADVRISVKKRIRDRG